MFGLSHRSPFTLLATIRLILIITQNVHGADGVLLHMNMTMELYLDGPSRSETDPARAMVRK